MESTVLCPVKSKRGTLDLKDLAKSAFMFFATAAGSGLVAIGIDGLNKQSLMTIAIASGSSTLAYVVKQLRTNSQGEMAPEPQKGSDNP